ncbi:hypothetical protein SCUP234_13398 [Seiridium cupressi]
MPNEFSSGLVYWMKLLVGLLRRLLDLGGIATPDGGTVLSERNVNQMPWPDLSHEDLMGVMDFTRSPWFYRMWTLQELVMSAGESLWIFLGSNTVNVIYLYRRSFLIPGPRLFNMEVQAMVKIRELRSPNDLARLPFLLALDSMARDCWDPRDKLFSLYGMLHRSHTSHAPLQKLRGGPPKPNYLKPTSRVYTEWTAWNLCCKKSAELLYFAVLSAKELDESSPKAPLPSWVPDYARLCHSHRSPDTTKFSMSWLRDSFNASSQRAILDKPYKLQGDHLHIPGVLAGSIQVVGEEIRSLPNWSTAYIAFLIWKVGWIDALGSFMFEHTQSQQGWEPLRTFISEIVQVFNGDSFNREDLDHLWEVTGEWVQQQQSRDWSDRPNYQEKQIPCTDREWSD